jgi:acetyltransferase-like isoleucine patch superfamily enzyme
MNHESCARKVISDFNLDESLFKRMKISSGSLLTIDGHDSNKVLFRDESIPAKIRINFNDAKNCSVFVGEAVRGDIQINVRGDSSIIYIGNGCHLRKTEIRSRQRNDFVAVGNEVTTTGKNVWISSNGGGGGNPAIIIGDDVMFSLDIVIRNSDAHPIFNLETGEILNSPDGSVIIEPHVWIAEQVSILKCVTLGACSIIGFGSIITKDIPRFSIAKGVPAKASRNDQICWARLSTKPAIAKARQFALAWRDGAKAVCDSEKEK